MCGIFGIVSREGEVSRELLAGAQQSLAHRGPDSSGTFLQNGDDLSIGFAHTRLSIIDLSPRGNQPMVDSALGLVLVFLAALPWIMVKGLSFRNLSSAWRGVRFGFEGKVGEAATVFLLWPLLGALTLGACRAAERERCAIAAEARALPAPVPGSEGHHDEHETQLDEQRVPVR